MNIQHQNGVVSTINFSPFFESEYCHSLRKEIFYKAQQECNISPAKQLDVYDESILVFNTHYDSLLFMSSVARIVIKMGQSTSCDISLRSSICSGNFFVHQDQIYGDAVNLATQLSYSARENEILVCGMNRQLIEGFTKLNTDIIHYVRDEAQNFVSLSVLDEDSTSANIKDVCFQVELNNHTQSYKSTRNKIINIGRSNNSDIFIDSDHISRNHATLTINYDDIFIEDHSANGTFIYLEERELFLMNDKMKLTSNGQISCGHSLHSGPAVNDSINFQLV